MNHESTRRRFVVTVGAGSVGATAGCTGRFSGRNSNATDPDGGEETVDGGNANDRGDDETNDRGDDGTSERGDDATTDSSDESEETEDVPSVDGGAVVFVYDDGPIEDYEQAFPVHQEFDAPASVGIVTEWIGRTDFNDTDWMDDHHLEELAAAGWEISSHTTRHTALSAFELVEDAVEGDTRIYPEQRNHGFHHGHEIEVTDGEESVRRTIVDSDHDDVGVYLEFDDPLETSFRAGEAVERYPADVMHEFLGESKRELERMGFTVDTLLAPYDAVDEWTVEIAREYYDGIANARPGSMFNEPEGFDPLETRRDYFVEFTTPADVEADLDRVAEEEAIGVLGAHTFKAEVTADRIRETLEWVEKRDLEVLTFRDAIRAVDGDRR
ncbi:polysaccharide deacetylase family protein [Natrarchaeobius chitinivorans]|uniref:Polysaccharide deacetylase n=1 Tax=Natrarchaeobius chitinivorans TaxID=1679083 RepID=A0A3N6LX98_NATCH|nr:polysaccharide deacetylase family protein [Natrarchaeobius chitinivorans]RQG95373.1 polysaccharide deacetylase [Natrarchaeobius chitinivorans]